MTNSKFDPCAARSYVTPPQTWARNVIEKGHAKPLSESKNPQFVLPDGGKGPLKQYFANNDLANIGRGFGRKQTPFTQVVLMQALKAIDRFCAALCNYLHVSSQSESRWSYLIIEQIWNYEIEWAESRSPEPTSLEGSNSLSANNQWNDFAIIGPTDSHARFCMEQYAQAREILLGIFNRAPGSRLSDND